MMMDPNAQLLPCFWDGRPVTEIFNELFKSEGRATATVNERGEMEITMDDQTLTITLPHILEKRSNIALYDGKLFRRAMDGTWHFSGKHIQTEHSEC